MDNKIDPFMEVIKKRERNKAYVIIIISILSTAGNFISILSLLNVNTDKIYGLFFKEYCRSLLTNIFWFFANIVAIFYGILICYKNKKSPFYDFADKSELEFAEKQLKESDDFLDNLPTNSNADENEYENDEDYEPRRYLSRRHGAKERLNLK